MENPETKNGNQGGPRLLCSQRRPHKYVGDINENVDTNLGKGCAVCALVGAIADDVIDTNLRKGCDVVDTSLEKGCAICAIAGIIAEIIDTTMEKGCTFAVIGVIAEIVVTNMGKLCAVCTVEKGCAICAIVGVIADIVDTHLGITSHEVNDWNGGKIGRNIGGDDVVRMS